MSKRHVVFIEGKWQGGSFATEKEADTVGRKSGKKYEVRERSAASASPEKSAEKPSDKPADEKPAKPQK